MKFITIKCPNCDATLEVNPDTKYCECEYCHRKIFIDDEVERVDVKVQSIFTDEAELKKQEVRDKISERKAEEKRRNDKILLIVLAGLMAFNLLWFLAWDISDYFKYRDKISMPEKSKYYLGRNYETVQAELEDLGFEEFELRTIDDLVIGFLSKEGDVESVSIAGIKNFEKGDLFKKTDKVVITYHVFPDKKKTKK